jgi:hypothetical protein
MKIKIKDKDLELHYSMRSFVIYEEITGKSLNLEDINSLSAIVNLFYSNVLATMQYNNMNLDLTYNDFWNWIDENNGPTLIQEFSEWYMQQLQAQADFNTRKSKKTTTADKTDNKKSKN